MTELVEHSLVEYLTSHFPSLLVTVNKCTFNCVLLKVTLKCNQVLFLPYSLPYGIPVKIFMNWRFFPEYYSTY